MRCECCWTGRTGPEHAPSAAPTSVGRGWSRSEHRLRGYSRRHGRGAHGMSMLKDRYLLACDRLIEELGTERVGHRIPEDATLMQCASYLNQHVVHDRTHFRWGRYSQMLDHYFRKHLGGHIGGHKPQVVHVDLGTGPGLFNWVVYDYVQEAWSNQTRPQLAQFGYDHSSAMVELAERIWTDFGLSHQIQFFTSTERLTRAVDAITGDAYLLITFGHVLIQSYNPIDRSAIKTFAQLCNRLASGRNAADLLAVDAYAYHRTQQFSVAARLLFRELSDSINAATHDPWERVDIPSSVLPHGSRALMSLRR